MTVLYKTYSTKDSALMGIKNEVFEFYESTYPEVFASSKEQIHRSVAEIQNGYANNIFPFMKADWRQYPNHIGHMEYEGCFRCHNDRHASEAGKVISMDCNLCHGVQAQGSPDSMQYSNSSTPLEFIHPVDIDEAWRTELCSSCHSELY